ncbi:glycosyltransferase family 4 protein [Paraburkholderia sediminicola]|uniref:glycosyltransferase family 4 protein n=1 Tax=Paraburkholderia sediminicola TaxID=458836 RepID=UPI0038BA4818
MGVTLNVRKKIALVTPWPPQASGIADYAYDLASCMIGPALDVHVVTNEGAPVHLAGVTMHHVDELAAGTLNLAAFDGILVQLGNHPKFHGYMLEIIRDFRCTVELHDVLLHHCLMGEGGLAANADQYYGWLADAYGRGVSDQFRQFLGGNGDILKCPIATQYPGSDFITSRASHVIVHSNHAKSVLVASGRVSDVTVVNLGQRLCDGGDEIMPEQERVRIGIFGGVQKNRQVDATLAALAKIDRQFSNWSLDIVGAVDADCAHFMEAEHIQGIREKVTLHGRLPLEQFQRTMQECDIVVSLRNPTMGETSAIVIRAMQMGLVSVVSDVGWYSELPGCVLKIDNANVLRDLERLLLALLGDRSLRAFLRRKTADYAAQRLDPRVLTDDILYLTLYGSEDESCVN